VGSCGTYFLGSIKAIKIQSWAIEVAKLENMLQCFRAAELFHKLREISTKNTAKGN